MSTILITGTTSGIGLEAAVALARQGNRLVLVGRDQRKTPLLLWKERVGS